MRGMQGITGIIGNGAASAWRGVLDLVPGTVAAYSLRLLSSKYHGPCVRVRRSSDNAESDIGFAGKLIDTLALAAFIGGGEGFVTTWYDQGGNAWDVTQPTASEQLKIITATGHVALQNDTLEKRLSKIGATPCDLTDSTVSLVYARSAAGIAQDYQLCSFSVGEIYDGAAVGIAGANPDGLFMRPTSAWTGVATGLASEVPAVIAVRKSGTLPGEVRMNGSVTGGDATSITSIPNAVNAYVGRNTGNYYECILWGRRLTDEQMAIVEQNQMASI